MKLQKKNTFFQLVLHWVCCCDVAVTFGGRWDLGHQALDFGKN